MTDFLAMLICTIFLMASCTEKGFTVQVNGKEYSLKIPHESEKKDTK